MKWMKSPLTRYERGNFLPIVIGSVLLFLSFPAFIMLLVDPDREALVLVAPLLVLFGAGSVLGFGFLWFGVRLCSYPGSRTYRITHGRIFSR
jgi:hypothetical protein